MKAPPLVLIEWEDSAQPDGAWRYLDGLDVGGVIRCTSVGYLVKDSDGVKALAQNVANVGMESAQASGIIRIPTRCVVSVKRLKP